MEREVKERNPLLMKKRIRKFGLQLCKYVGVIYLKCINTQVLQRCWKTGTLRHAQEYKLNP